MFVNNYKVGEIVSGKVSGIENYGIFVLLEDGTYGMIHISEISDKFVKDVEKYAKINDVIKAEIIDYDSDNNHYKLSLKNLGSNGDSKKRQKIEETPKGFSTLKSSLDRWIDLKTKR